MKRSFVIRLNALARAALAGLLTFGAVAAARADSVSLRGAPAQLDGGHLSDRPAELSRRGRHFEAMAAYFSFESEVTLADQLGAARSAWALGLVEQARKIWDDALSNNDFKGEERNRTVLARSIVELQESSFEEARAVAERAANTLESSDLRAQFWLVIAEALKEQNANSLAEGYYKKAIEDGSREIQTEARFLLGECQRKLGMVNDARYSYASVEAGSPYTLQALRRLVEIDLSQRNYEGVLTWVSEGRESYPGEFKEGWVSYAYVSALTELGRNDEARKELQDFRNRRSEKDPWYTLAEAMVEARLVSALILGAVLNDAPASAVGSQDQSKSEE